MSIREDIQELEKDLSALKEQSFAMEILQDYKKDKKRQFIIILVILVMWFITIGYLVFLLKNMSVEETSTSQIIEDVNEIQNSNIVNGDFDGENKTNKEN